ncbi:MAG: hypothetical protein KJ666_02855 [Bacteroidetes bacterium]|nr:hypothetical protein [Bacteroidota bacterium]
MNFKIPFEAVQKIHDKESFFLFLRDQLNWRLSDNLSFEDLTYFWDVNEFGYTKNYFKGSSIHQLRPFNNYQPWGIFIIELKNTPTAYHRIERNYSWSCPNCKKG